MDTIALVRDGNTARVTTKIPATAQGKGPMRRNKSMGLSIVVRSFNNSTLASAGIRATDSLGVILVRKRKITRVIPVNTPEQEKNMPTAISLEEAVATVTREVIGGAIPERPWPVMMAWV